MESNAVAKKLEIESGLPIAVRDVAGALRAKIVGPRQLSSSQRAQMFALMSHYYANVSEAQFRLDLDAKNHVILLQDASDEIRGFSTLLTTEQTIGGKLVRLVYSGDTVVDKDYWGQKVLGVAFLKYLFLQKVRSPLTPVYWMLISKGYKTYLLMANNFREHFPRFEKPTPPRIREIMDTFYEQKFGNAYSREQGLIFPHASRLREGVAGVTEELARKYPRVRFFVQCNPQWSEGVELACIAKMTFLMPVIYFFKKTFKGLSK